jgi:D-sedoheptulose 7-phosphate isomerase
MFKLQIESKKLINLLNFNLSDQIKVNKIAKKIKEFSKKKKSKFLVCGNGGSATDADHFVTELVVRFKKKRKSLPAISLSSNPGLLTACANDFNFEYIFKRQIESLANKDDCIIFISTSGNSKNLIEAAKYAKKKNIFSIALLGKSGGKLKNYCNLKYIVKSQSVANIQEVHIFLLHYFCQVIES